MLVPNKVRKNAIFIGIKDADGFKPKATGFIVSTITDQHRFLNVVTAEHVIVGLQNKGFDRPYMQLNMESGGAEIFPTEYNEWRFHPDHVNPTDVAVLPCAIDRASVVYSHTPANTIATDKIIKKQHIGIGDEIFIVGLFKNHYGKRRNVPIVRIGNIALMLEEPVYTKYAGYIDAYLVEARSISGLSGSPVWVHMPPWRIIDGEVVQTEGAQYYLLGLMHGHFDVRNLNEDMVLEDTENGRGINTGIGVVVPGQKILDVIERPELEKARREIVKELRKRKGATADLAVVEDKALPTTDENP